VTTQDRTNIAEGARVEVSFRCRDIGYGIEEGEGVYTYRGRESGGKLTFEPTDGSEPIYLFDDEVLKVEYVETITLPPAMVAVRKAAAGLLSWSSGATITADRLNARQVLDVYASRPGSACLGNTASEDYAADLVDLISDLLHLADEIGTSSYMEDGEAAARMALSHYRDERDEEDETAIVCSRCSETYDETRGDGYCGLCPACADATEPNSDEQ
jgi:hypothetical protein